jgi:hypothetical protein
MVRQLAPLRHRFTWVCLIGLVHASSGCIFSHENDDPISASSTVQYGGFADLEDTVVVEVLNRSTGTWRRVARTTAGTDPIYFGGLKLYWWQAGFRLDSLSDWQCYVSPACVFTEGAQLHLRARSLLSTGGTKLQLYTFDHGARGCTYTEVSAGATIPDAYDTCMDGQSKQELSLWVYP